MVARPACYGFGVEHGADDSLVHALDSRPEHLVNILLVHQADGFQPIAAVMGQLVSGGEGQGNLAAAVAGNAAGTGNAGLGALCHPLQLPG